MPDTKTLHAGSRAPLFTLKDERGRSVALKDLLRTTSVILIFYPGDMTPGCAMQLCAVRDAWKKFRDAGAAVYGVNHADAESHATFSETYNFPFPLLIDKGKRVSQKYGAVKPFFNTKIIKRTVVGIGKNGIIFFCKRGMPKDSEILKAIKNAYKS